MVRILKDSSILLDLIVLILSLLVNLLLILIMLLVNLLVLINVLLLRGTGLCRLLLFVAGLVITVGISETMTNDNILQ